VRRVGVFVLVLSVLLMAPGRPWRARRRAGLRPNHILTERALPSDWPAEPRSPQTVEPEAFARALHEICGYMPPGRDERWASWILEYSAEFSVDPFMVAALVYRQSRCLPDAENVDGPGLGLTQIHREMYAEQLRGGVLRWRVLADGSWVERERRVDRFPFAGPRLLMAEPNIYFAAALLAMWKDQHETLDQEFDQTDHRHWVSHFVWGDAVRSDWEEERIFSDRRRLLEYYGARGPMAPIRHEGLELGCPLDGCPRVVLSWLGAEREDGARSHRGIDVDSLPGEPVRAISDGFVYFAGVDLPGHRSHVQIASEDGYDQYARGDLGAGGRYACVRHGRAEGDESSMRSCYMHMETVEVAYGERVTRGQRIGTVGRTGMQRSAAHLHLEMHTGETLEDASVVLRGLLIGRPPEDPRARR
jgi:murein DD-endopeptidase MepM/ murein hydrolase activator NlpD